MTLSKEWWKQQRIYLILLVLASLVPLFMPNRYLFHVVIMSCLMAVGALSYNLLLGFTGQASLAHGAFLRYRGLWHLAHYPAIRLVLLDRPPLRRCHLGLGGNDRRHSHITH